MKQYVFEGKTFNRLPDPFGGISPMTEERFVELGGTITDDGMVSPKERICAAFADMIADLAQKTNAITPAEFLAAARNGISSDLITLARERGVPETVIAKGRARIIEIMADALRFNVSWTDLVTGAAEA